MPERFGRHVAGIDTHSPAWASASSASARRSISRASPGSRERSGTGPTSRQGGGGGAFSSFWLGFLG